MPMYDRVPFTHPLTTNKLMVIRRLIAQAMALTLPLLASSQTETEPNNSSTQTNPLAYNTVMVGSMGACSSTDNSADWFLFNIPNQGVLRVQSTMSTTGASPVNVNFTLINSGGSNLGTFPLQAGASGVPVSDEFRLTCRGVGAFRIGLSFPGGVQCINYSFQFDIVAPGFASDTEPNTISAPQAVAPATWTTGQCAFVPGDNSDFFLLNLPSNGQLNIEWEAEHAGTDNAATATLQLYNTGGSVIQTATVPVGANSTAAAGVMTRICSGNVAAYRLGVVSAVCGTSYRFRYTVSPPVFANDPEPNNTTGQLTPLDLTNASAPGQLGFEGQPDDDLYLFAHPGGPYTITVSAEHANTGEGSLTMSVRTTGGGTVQTFTVPVGGSSLPLTNTFTIASLGAANYRLYLQDVTCGVSYRLHCYDDDGDGTCNGSDLCPGGPEPGTPCDDGNSNTSGDVIDVGCVCAGAVVPVSVPMRMMLEGPYVPSTGLMNDALRGVAAFPTTDPYPALGYSHVGSSNSGSVAPAVLAVTGNDAVVDWVIAELRSSAAPASIIVSRSVLLQRDGDVVELDGVSPVSFPVGPNSYHVAVRHRNHLGAMTAAPVALSSSSPTVDFTTTATATYGTAARKSVAGTFPAQVLWAGEVTFNAEIKYTGSGNDRDPILVTVGSTTPNNVVSNTYSTRDVNMNGEVKYTGSGNDRDPILVNVGSTTPNNTRVQQLP